MSLKILTCPNNKNAQKARIAAEFVGVDIEEPPFEWGVTNKTEEFHKFTPIGKVPVLVTPRGSIFESNAIARYVARLGESKLFGSDEFENGQVDQWIDFASNELGTPLMKWASPVCGWGTYDEEVVKVLKTEASRGLAALEKSLAVSSTDLRLVGKDVTLADIIMLCELVVPWQCILSEDYLKPYPTVTKYVTELLKLPQFQKVIGDVQQASEVPTGPLPPEKNPFNKPKRASSDTNGHGEKDTKKAKVAES